MFRICPICKGSGKTVDGGWICPNCNGEGKVYVYFKEQDKLILNSYINMGSYDSLRVEIASSDNLYNKEKASVKKCHLCHGYGIIEGYTCSFCEGSGYILK